MEPSIIDYYNDIPNIVNVIDKMNDEYSALQAKYDLLCKTSKPSHSIEKRIQLATQSHNDMAKLLYYFYGEYNVCTSLKRNDWYHYDLDMKKWRYSDQGIELRIKLSNEIHDMFMKRGDDFINNEEYNEEEPGEPPSFYGYHYFKTGMDLKNPNYKQKIMKECREVFYKKDFLGNNKDSIEDISEYYKYNYYGDLFKIK